MHIESVHEGRKYICSYCGEEFTSQSRLDGHVAFNHDRSKLYKCTFCDSEFRFEYYLKDHIALVHEKTTRYLCTHCGQSCLNQGDLNFHIKRMHELDGKKPFQCSECDRSYKMSATLKEHIKTVHRGEKIKCTLCEKSFCSQKSVRIHIEAVHEKKRPHACGLCGERFGQKSHLNTHIKGKHKGQKNWNFWLWRYIHKINLFSDHLTHILNKHCTNYWYFWTKIFSSIAFATILNDRHVTQTYDSALSTLFKFWFKVFWKKSDLLLRQM